MMLMLLAAAWRTPSFPDSQLLLGGGGARARADTDKRPELDANAGTH